MKVQGVTEELQQAAWRDLREFLDIARTRGDLVVIKGADPHLEMGALYELSLRKLFPPILLFEDIKGYDKNYRVATNVRTSPLLVGNLDLDAVRELRRQRQRGIKNSIPPQTVNTGPVLANVQRDDDVKCTAFPAPKWHPLDGGNYIGTECLVINKDPDEDWVNVGTYRTMVHDDKTLAVFIEPGKHGDIIRRKYWQRGEACPIVVCVGQAPVLGNLAGSPSGQGVSELAQAGGRIGEAIRVVNGEVTGLPFPADAELVFEGFMPPPEVESRPEGPFAEWTGYYASDTRPEPVVKVSRVYYRDDLIVLGQPPAKPTYPGRQFNIISIAALWDALEQAGVPEIKAVWKLRGGGTRFINVISIRQAFPGHAKFAGMAAIGTVGAFMGRINIIVDDDIDVTDTAEVLWALATRWDPATQTDIISNCWTGNLDPTLSPEKRESGDLTNSRIVIYAVRPFHWKDDYPKVNQFDSDELEKVRKKWEKELPFCAPEIKR
jgi:4-hydroxy-3-polyprenylbenzoate decarboxylase